MWPAEICARHEDSGVFALRFMDAPTGHDARGEISRAVAAAIKAELKTPGSPIHSLKHGQARLAEHDAEIEPKLQELRSTLAKHEAERAELEKAFHVPGLAEKLAAVDRCIAADCTAIDEAKAGRNLLVPLVEQHKPAAVKKALSVAQAAVREYTQALAARRRELVAAIATKCRTELEELASATAAQAEIEMGDAGPLAKGLGSAALAAAKPAE